MGDAGACPGEPRWGTMSGLCTQGPGQGARTHGCQRDPGRRDGSCFIAAGVLEQGAVSGACAWRDLSGVFWAGFIPARLAQWCRGGGGRFPHLDLRCPL